MLFNDNEYKIEEKTNIFKDHSEILCINAKERFLKALKLKSAKAIDYSNKYRKRKEEYYEIQEKNKNLLQKLNELKKEICFKKKNKLIVLNRKQKNNFYYFFEVLMRFQIASIYFYDHIISINVVYDQIYNFIFILQIKEQEINCIKLIQYNLEFDNSSMRSCILTLIVKKIFEKQMIYANITEFLQEIIFSFRSALVLLEIFANPLLVLKDFWIEISIDFQKLIVKYLARDLNNPNVLILFDLFNWMDEPIIVIKGEDLNYISFDKLNFIVKNF